MKLFVDPLHLHNLFYESKTTVYTGLRFRQGKKYIIGNIKHNFLNHWEFHGALTNIFLQIQVSKFIHTALKIALN